MKALILIDIQTDYGPAGAVQIEEADQVVALANRIMEEFDLVVASKDWHPANHVSFAANHLWRRPGQMIALEQGDMQLLWPMHCVQNTFGANFIAGLRDDRIVHTVQKGEKPEIDSYSAFSDNNNQHSTGLDEYLRNKKVSSVYIMGLATDYSVLYTAMDALKLGFDTYVIEDGCRGINQRPEDSSRALKKMKRRGASIIQSAQLLQP